MKYHNRKRLLQFRSVRAGRNWLKKIKIKKGEHLSLYKFFKIFLFNIEENEILDRANGVAYNFILAIFPTIIFLFTLIPYLSQYYSAISTEGIMMFLEGYMPASMYDVISSTVLDIVSKQRGGLLTFGFLFAMILATNGMVALMRAFNACYKTVENRGFFRMRGIAFILTILLAMVIMSAAVLLIVGEVLLNRVTPELSNLSHISSERLSLYSLLLLRFIVIFIVFFFTVSLIYYFGPAIHYNWKFFSIGSFLATLACLGISYGFSYYVTSFGSYNKVYGSIGVLIAFMVWMQLLTTVLLFGYEVNAAIHYGHKLEAIERHKRLKRRVAAKN